MMDNITEGAVAKNAPLADATCFIETQFPVAKISMESYKERTAKQSQTLTGLGKWWGRKPLILVRAVLLGLLLPATDNPEKDREIYLKLLTMDANGLRRRKSKPILGTRLVEELRNMPPTIQKRFMGGGELLSKLSKEVKAELQYLVFDRMSYREKLTYCDRPEHIDGPSPDEWSEINNHLGTHAVDLSSLVQELGELRFGHRPRVGDAFCGGGSIPFESARLGFDCYATDLNPVAALLTWSALNVVGGGAKIVTKIRNAQETVFNEVNKQITEWEIEHNSLGWRADQYLYCMEVIDPETGWKIPLAGSWVIGEKTKTVAKLIPDPSTKSYQIDICEGVSESELIYAKQRGTVKDYRLVPPYSDHSTPIELIRKGMRLWVNEDISPLPNDIFQERLYCIRWVETYTDKNGKQKTRKHYRAPSQADNERETKVLQLLKDRFDEWQEKGYIPKRSIEFGQDINRPTIARGFTFWHHLFNPRQLITTGLFVKYSNELNFDHIERVGLLLGVGRIVNWNSRLTMWITDAANEKGAQTFYKPSLSTPFWNYSCRAFSALDTVFLASFSGDQVVGKTVSTVEDARSIGWQSDYWITDPPYADAVNYHQLSEYFLAWYEKHIPLIFPSWYSDSKRALAVTGMDLDFRKSMVACYRNLQEKMVDNGYQVVMFTHQNAGVWADLTLILWAAGLRVASAWTIATETDSTFKAGNFVQGTVILVLKKRTETMPVFIDEISYKVEAEVRRQLNSMIRLEDNSDPNFGDADYQLAAYAAALRVITNQPIHEIDPEKEILRERKSDEVGPVEQLIRQAVKIACDHLIPKGLDGDLWKTLGPMERFYIKGLEVESHGEYRSGVYQELARGFGANDYTTLFESGKANATRLKRASEFGKKMLGTYDGSSDAFADSLVRQCLFAVSLTVKNEDTREGMDYLHTELRDAYWANREKITGVLEYLAALRHSAPMEHWQKDSHAASLLAGAVRNDHV